MSGRRIGRLGRGLMGLITLTVLAVGLPIALYRFGGSPIPSRLPAWHQVMAVLLHQDNGGLFIAAVRDISWLAWLAFAISVVVEAQAAIRGRKAPRLRLGGVQGVACHLVALAALVFTAPVSVSLAASSARAVAAQPAVLAAHHEQEAQTLREPAPKEPAQALSGTQLQGMQRSATRPNGTQPPVAVGAVSPVKVAVGAKNAGSKSADGKSTDGKSTDGRSTDGRSTGTKSTARAAAGKVTAKQVAIVRPGDCLWTIAEHYLGAGDDYHEIVALNLGHQMDNGVVFTDPSLIEPGWHLLLPAGATAPTAGSSQHGSGQHGTGEHGSGEHGTGQHGTGEHSGHRSAHSRFSNPHSAAGHGSTRTGTGHAGTGTGTGQPAGPTVGGTQAAGAGPRSGAAHSDHDQVVEVTLFALGMLAGAALASIDRLRHRQRQYRQPGRRIAMPADPQGRAIERKLRAAAAHWPADQSGSADDAPEPSPDYPVPGDRPEWPDLPEPVDLRGPAGNRLPPGGLEPFDAAEAFSYARAPGTGEYDDEDYGDEDYGDQDYSEASRSQANYGQDQYEPAASAPAESATVGATPATLRDALRELSEGIAVGGEPLPPIVGIHLTADALDVLLSAPAATPPPAPFTIAPARQAMCWTVNLGAHAGAGAVVPPVPGEVGDLLPGLFTAGATDAGGYLLLDLEAMRVTCCDGPADLTDRLLVTAATELAASHWSGWYDLVLAGCDELEVLGRAELCSTLDEAIDVLEARTRAVARRLDDQGPADVRTRRLADPDDEDWGLTLLVSRLRPTPAQMGRLLALADGPGGIAALIAGDTQTEDGKLAPALFQLAPDPEPGDGHDIVATITLAYLGPQHQISVWPQTLTMPEYQALAGVFATAADLADVPLQAAPYGDFSEAPWIRMAAAPVAPDDAPPVGANWPEHGFSEPRHSEPPPAGADGPEPRVSEPRVSEPRFSEPRFSEPRHSEPRHSQPQHSEPRFEPDRLDQLLSHAGYLGPDRHDEPDQLDPAHAQPSPPFEPSPPHPPVPPYQPAHGHRSGSAPKSGSSSRPRHAAPSLRIDVLGPVQITGAEQPLEPKQAELLLALALHAPVGVSNSGLAGLLGTDADHPRPADSVRQLITKTRKRLGHAPDGQEYIIHLGGGIYVPHGDLALDWASFSALARRGRAERRHEDLRAAMALVRGEPFADCYHWWIDVSLIETMRAEVIDTAELLSQLELAAGDSQAAARAAKAGLATEPAAEQLWRALMRAESQAGNPDGVAAAWTGCLDAIEEIAPGGEPHPDTEQLYRQLATPAPLTSRR